MSAVSLTRDGMIACLRLCQPPRNTMTKELMRAFDACLDELQTWSDVRAVVVASTGCHFCAGAELTNDVHGTGRVGWCAG